MDTMKDMSLTVVEEVVRGGTLPWEGQKMRKDKGGEPLEFLA